jgi:hypothetical protein
LYRYTAEDLDREYSTVKSCASFCTVGCVHRVAVIDEFREDPRNALSRFFPHGLPRSVRILKWLFLPKPDGRQTAFAGLAAKLFRLR